MSVYRKKTVGAALAAVLLVAGLTACGGGKEAAGGEKAAGAGAEGAKAAEAEAVTPVEAVKAAYLKTVPAKFAAMDMSITDRSGKVVQMRGTKGWYPSSTSIESTGPGVEPQVMQGDVIYTHLDKPLQGKSWMKMDLNKAGEPPRVKTNDDPAEYLGLLLGQEKLTLVGTEQLDGAQTRHYRGSFTAAELLAADESTKVMEEKERLRLREALKAYTSLEVDLWLDKDGYPVRVDTVQGSADGTSKVSAKFSGFGSTAPVTPPPADQVADLDGVLKGVDDSLAETDRTLKEADKTLKEADKTLRDAGLGGLDGS
ncbi:hypothetical protein [Streptomyces xanthophaeus]|uniref:hypothetical protein n=1 Tax=Streptomyces xanthophaeus TaxID=67385 RepID=UPI0037120452